MLMALCFRIQCAIKKLSNTMGDMYKSWYHVQKDSGLPKHNVRFAIRLFTMTSSVGERT